MPKKPDYFDRGFDMQDPEYASIFDECSFWCSRFGRMMMEHVPLLPDQDVLDVGTGGGFPLFELAHSLGPGSRLTGLDTGKKLPSARR